MLRHSILLEFRLLVLGVGMLLAFGSLAAEQFMPLPSYRIGPYAAGGSGVFGGMIDYFNLINRRDGGINGVKISWEECETEYKNDLALQCYEQLKQSGGDATSMFHFLSTGATYSALEQTRTDRIPLLSIGYGRADSADGRVFPYTFPLITTYWSQNTAIIKFIGRMEGGMQQLKGKRIVNLYHDSDYGRETLAILQKQAGLYDFQVENIAVPHPGVNQQAQWRKVLTFNPDWVVLRGWGVMTAAALRHAQRVGFPREQIVGVWWSAAEEDVVPAGDAAVGYIAAGFHPGGTDFPVHSDLKIYVYDQGLGNMQDANRVGSIYHNRGLITAMISVEGIRQAQRKFGNRTLSGEEVRWGIENLQLDEKAISDLGFSGLAQPLKVSCLDHEGGGAVKFSQWDGKRWNQLTDWISSDQKIVRPMVEASAARYANEHGIELRDCNVP
ncbi:MAG: ABC transporter substrate-binding protein [Motiliproteus sp.]